MFVFSLETLGSGARWTSGSPAIPRLGPPGLLGCWTKIPQEERPFDKEYANWSHDFFQSSPLHLWQRCDIWSPTCTRMLGSVLFMFESNHTTNWTIKNIERNLQNSKIALLHPKSDLERRTLCRHCQASQGETKPASFKTVAEAAVGNFLKLRLFSWKFLSQLWSFTSLAVQPSGFGG